MPYKKRKKNTIAPKRKQSDRAIGAEARRRIAGMTGRFGRNPEIDESAFFLSILFIFSAFFALLLFAASLGASYDIERTVASLRNPVPRIRTTFERDIAEMVDGYPIGSMTRYIADRDPDTAKFLISIAKHESGWGRRSPTDAAGKTCYNYWGFRGGGDHVTASGYSCFGSPKEAISVVGSRLEYLIHGLSLDTPEELIVWKCGSSCAGHDPGDVANWIGTVDAYAQKVTRIAGVETER